MVFGGLAAGASCIGALCRGEIGQAGQHAKKLVTNTLESGAGIGYHAVQGLGASAPLLESGAVIANNAGYNAVGDTLALAAAGGRMGKLALDHLQGYEDLAEDDYNDLSYSYKDYDFDDLYDSGYEELEFDNDL